MAPSRVLSLDEEYDLVAQGDRGLGQLVLDQVLLNPSSIAVIDGSYSLTYAQLHLKALDLAKQLRDAGYLAEESTGVLVNYGAQDVVTQLAIIYAGGTCVTLDPSLPNSQLQSRLERADVRHILVDTHNQGRLAEFFHEILVIEVKTFVESIIEDDINIVETNLGHRTHIIYTSGTTSAPKGVQILGRSIVQVAFHAPFIPFESTDRVAHVNNTSFDVSLFEIWAPLLQGATIVVLPKSDLLDPLALAETLERYQVTVMMTNTAILNLVAVANPSAFKRLKLCFFGGEAANVKAIRKILENGPPQQLINAYGPTETCIMALARRITMEDVEDNAVSIGGPIGQTQVYILNEDLKPVVDGEAGELFIGGVGVARGYLNDTAKTAASFFDLSGLEKSGESLRLYRTGDVVKRAKNGLIYYIGRQDHQVKVRGFRVELEAVETAILNTGRFSQATALRIESPEEGGGGILVAYAVANPSLKDPLNEIANVLKASVPAYMVPRIELIKQLPLNAHDKVDRKKLTQLYLSGREASMSSVKDTSTEATTITRLRKLWANMLATSVEECSDDSDFFNLGGTSLQAAVLIHQIREAFGTEISSLALYENPKLSELASVIDKTLNGKTLAIKDDRELWVKDVTIADYILPAVGDAVDWRSAEEGHVFLTGATGFVGAFLLHELLVLPEVKQVACLVRATDSTTGFQRIRQALSKYGLWKEVFYPKVLALPGDLHDETFGLGHDLFDVLAKWSSVIFHLGAHVNFTQPYSVHRPANVVGTMNVLRFAAAGRRTAIQYVSSISCFGPTGFFTGATRIEEDADLSPHLAALPYDHGYAQSQWVCEQMLWSAISRGFPVAIYRPGFVTGHSETGVCNRDDFFSRLMVTCLEMKYYPLLPNHRSEYVPVDYVISAILHISSTKNLGHAYHIVPRDDGATPGIVETFHLTALNGVSDLQSLPYKEWVAKVAESENGRMKPLVPMLTERIHLGLTRWELYEHMPVLETINLDRALAGYPGGLECPEFDAVLLEKYLKYWAQT